MENMEGEKVGGEEEEKQGEEREENKLTTDVTVDPSAYAIEIAKARAPGIVGYANDMFNKVSDYVQGTLKESSEDFRLLETMNNMTIEKYAHMGEQAELLNTSMSSLTEKYDTLGDYFKQIDEVDSMVGELEHAALRLDAYSKRLEAKFKELERR